MSDALLAARTLPLPRVLWIELTSRCPFDCVFCSIEKRVARSSAGNLSSRSQVMSTTFTVEAISAVKIE